MNWNGFCVFTLMCFGQPITHLNSDYGLCSFYTSDDISKMSLVLDIRKQVEDSTDPQKCLDKGQLNTLLLYSNKVGDKLKEIKFTSSGNYEHLIVLYTAFPKNLCNYATTGKVHATSLTVLENDNLEQWDWLKCHRFKYIWIEKCSVELWKAYRTATLILSLDLLVLTLVDNINLHPWVHFGYDAAPMLRGLVINDHIMPYMFKKPIGSFPELRRLDLQNNRINTFEEEFFESMPKLVELNVERNNLQTFDFTFNSWPRKVYINDNPLVGDAKTCEFLRSANFAFYIGGLEICPELRGQNKSLHRFLPRSKYIYI